MTLPALAVGGAMNVGANLATNSMTDTDRAYAKLCAIDDKLAALLAYNQRERERTPLVAEIGVLFTAGVPSARIDFIPQSSFNIDNIIMTCSVAGVALELRMGTRGPIWITDIGTEPMPLPYHLNAGQLVTILDPSGAANINVRGFIVGWYEQNRTGPQRVIGTD